MSAAGWRGGAIAAALYAAACGDGIGVPIRAIEAAGAGGGASERDAGDSWEDEPDYDAEHCAAALDGWPEEFAIAEERLLDSINERRDRQIRCGERERSDLQPLRVEPALQCAARLHARDMAERGFEGSRNPEDESPGDRMRAAGYRPDDWSESWLSGPTDVDGALLELLGDWDDCMNLATRELTEVGIGRYGDKWTLDFARD